MTNPELLSPLPDQLARIVNRLELSVFYEFSHLYPPNQATGLEGKELDMIDAQVAQFCRLSFVLLEKD